MFNAVLKGPPYDIVVEKTETGGHRVDVEIARDETRLVAVTCEFSPIDYNGVIFVEFSFSIAVAPLDGCGCEHFVTQDRSMASAYIPESVRGKIMPMICACIQSMIAYIQPLGVYRVIKEVDLPPKALAKHHMITKVLTGLGYFVEEEGTDSYGRRFYLMPRKHAH